MPESRPSSNVQLLPEATKHIEDAILHDKAGNYSDALTSYQKALKGMLQLWVKETKPASKAALGARIDEYMSRAEQIAHHLSQPPPVFNRKANGHANLSHGKESLQHEEALSVMEAEVGKVKTAMDKLQQEQLDLLKRLATYESKAAEATSGTRNQEEISQRRYNSDTQPPTAIYYVSVPVLAATCAIQCAMALFLVPRLEDISHGRIPESLLQFCALVVAGVIISAPFWFQRENKRVLCLKVPCIGDKYIPALPLTWASSKWEMVAATEVGRKKSSEEKLSRISEGPGDDQEAPAPASSNQEPAPSNASGVAHSSKVEQTPAKTQEAGPTDAVDENTEIADSEAADTHNEPQTLPDILVKFDTLMKTARKESEELGHEGVPPSLTAAHHVITTLLENGLKSKTDEVAVRWRHAKCLNRQANCFPKSARARFLADAYEAAVAAHNVAEGVGAEESDAAHVLLWYGIAIAEHRIPTANGNNEKIAATKDFVEAVNASYTKSQALHKAHPQRSELLASCCFVLGCFHIESTKTINKLGWMLRKLVARFLPPTSFQEATNFLQQAISHGYHDLKAAAAWLAVAQQLDGKTNQAKETLAKHQITEAHFAGDESLRKNLKRMRGVF